MLRCAFAQSVAQVFRPEAFGPAVEFDVIPSPPRRKKDIAFAVDFDVIPRRFAAEGYPVPKFRDGESASSSEISNLKFEISSVFLSVLFFVCKKGMAPGWSGG
jgi:hypothetical protein